MKLEGFMLLAISVLISAVMNILVNVITYVYKERKKLKYYTKQIVTIIDDDLSKFILIAEQIADSYRRSFTIWYD